MLSKEIKKLIDVSEGKVILSEGEVDKSYVVMKLNKYLEEKNIVTAVQANNTKPENKKSELTDRSFLDKMSADVETIREKEIEEKVESDLLEKKTGEEFNYDYSS